MINLKDIDILLSKEEFKKNHSLVINNFLDNDFAEKLNQYYLNEFSKNQWCATYMPSTKFPESWEWWLNVPHNKYNMQMAYAHVTNARDSGLFSYFFYKIMEDKISELSSTIHKEAMTLFNHKNILELLSNITELNLTKYDKTFVSKYSEKCFLSEHTDEPNGKLAFVYHLTKNWNPDWGGLYLNLTDKNNIKTICPSFNKLVIFDVKNYKTPHSVTQVVDNCIHERISITGWYD